MAIVNDFNKRGILGIIRNGRIAFFNEGARQQLPRTYEGRRGRFLGVIGGFGHARHQKDAKEETRNDDFHEKLVENKGFMIGAFGCCRYPCAKDKDLSFCGRGDTDHGLGIITNYLFANYPLFYVLFLLARYLVFGLVFVIQTPK